VSVIYNCCPGLLATMSPEEPPNPDGGGSEYDPVGTWTYLDSPLTLHEFNSNDEGWPLVVSQEEWDEHFFSPYDDETFTRVGPYYLSSVSFGRYNNHLPNDTGDASTTQVALAGGQLYLLVRYSMRFYHKLQNNLTGGVFTSYTSNFFNFVFKRTSSGWDRIYWGKNDALMTLVPHNGHLFAIERYGGLDGIATYFPSDELEKYATRLLRYDGSSWAVNTFPDYASAPLSIFKHGGNLYRLHNDGVLRCFEDDSWVTRGTGIPRNAGFTSFATNTDQYRWSFTPQRRNSSFQDTSAGLYRLDPAAGTGTRVATLGQLGAPTAFNEYYPGDFEYIYSLTSRGGVPELTWGLITQQGNDVVRWPSYYRKAALNPSGTSWQGANLISGPGNSTIHNGFVRVNGSDFVFGSAGSRLHRNNGSPTSPSWVSMGGGAVDPGTSLPVRFVSATSHAFFGGNHFISYVREVGEPSLRRWQVVVARCDV
jgi:hypothetical protein